VIYGGDKPSGIRIDRPPGSRHLMVTLTAGPDFSEADLATVQAKAADNGVTAGEFVAQTLRAAIDGAGESTDPAAAARPRAKGTRKGKKVNKNRSVEITCRLVRHIADRLFAEAKRLGWKPRTWAEILLANHALTEPSAAPDTGKATPSAKIRPARRTWMGVDLEPDVYAAHEQRAKAAGISPDDLFHLTIEQYVAKEKGNPQPPAGKSTLHVLKKHAAAIETAAKVLDIPVQMLLNWQLDYVTTALNDPQGLLGDYAVGGALEFRSKAAAEKVRANFVRWPKRKGVDKHQIEVLSRPRLTDDQVARVADRMVA
jgi:hypothetical protein